MPAAALLTLPAIMSDLYSVLVSRRGRASGGFLMPVRVNNFFFFSFCPLLQRTLLCQAE